MSATLDSPRLQSTFISRSSAWVSVLDLFRGIELDLFRGALPIVSCSIRRSTNELVSRLVGNELRGCPVALIGTVPGSFVCAEAEPRFACKSNNPKQYPTRFYLQPRDGKNNWRVCR